MRSSGPLVAVLLLAAAFAGCLGGEDEPLPIEPAANESEDLTAVDDGTDEMDTDLGHMPHLHDYWQGKERVTIMDADVEVDQFMALAFTFFNAREGTPGVGGTWFTLPEGGLVYEGTGKMEITPTWTDPTVTGALLRYRSPGATDFSEPMALAQGQPLSIDVAPEMTDMPHDKESRWMFLLSAPQGGTLLGKVHMRVDIVRMGDITLFPGHPELFGGANTLVLFDGAAKSSSQNFASMILGFATDNMQESGVRSSKVVPMETLSMTANVTITSTTSNIGEVAEVDFLYNAAGSFRGERAQVLSSDPAAGIYQFGWAVDMRMTDSPYADESQWTFDLLIETDPTGTGSQLGSRGLADAQVDYTLQVVAYDTLLEGIEPVQDEDERGR
jgi:hypothetical protein